MKALFLVMLSFVSLTTPAQTEEENIKTVVTTAYIEAIHNGGPVENIRTGFHPTFVMLRLVDNKVNPLPIEDWIKNIEASRTKTAGQTPIKTEGKFISVTVAGTSGNVVLELFRDGKKIFTDNLLLYKFSEGWRIVSKTFYKHP